MKIGIIGFGRFGQLIARLLKNDFDIYVANRSDKSRIARKLGVNYVSLEEAASKDIVIIATSISSLEDVLKKIKKCLKKNAVVIDVCSIKEKPAKLMKKILPKTVDIIGAHPLFGPDAFPILKRKKIVLCPIRTDKLSKIKSYLKKKKKIEVIITTPEKHDREIAKSLCLVHFIGRALIDNKIDKLEIDTYSYNKLLEILNIVRNDSKQLFIDMNRMNKYSKKIRHDFIKSLQKIDKTLK